MPPFNTVLLIANPAAQNGNGAKAADHAARLLNESLPSGAFKMVLTEGASHAVHLAEQAGSFDAVVALGGDGVIHEVANGLMRIAACDRPALGVIPVGSGNDYARTLNVPTKVDAAVAALLAARPRPADVGCCNGEFFVETLSFGLDAAIALETMERRKRTGRTGTVLYAEAGVNQLLHHLEARHFTAVLEGAAPLGYSNASAAAQAHGAFADEVARASLASQTLELEGESFVFAVQIGQTYGGGFRICPDARIDDGLFDVCIARPPISVPRALRLFARAKNGKHVGARQVEHYRAQALTVRFDAVPPAQLDGEPIPATDYRVTMCPRALKVLMS